MRRSRLIATAAAGLTLIGAAPAAAEPVGPPPPPGTRSVLFIGNNWDGTADIVDAQSFQKLARMNIVPDLQERLFEKQTNPVDFGYFIAIRQLVGEGHDQFVDDIFSSHDGRFVYVSRPSLADVVGIDLGTQKIVWRFEMDGQRSDHMAISPDGTRLLVSDSTARKVHALDTATGKKVGEFESGDSPHENNYSKDGSRIFHASIGMVYTPADQPVADSTKGDRYFQIVDAASYKVLKRLDIGKVLEENGYKDYSSAVRPMAIAPDEKTAYLQLSFLHGFVEFDLETDKPKRIATLPVSEAARDTPREEYLLDSAHHGLAMNPEGTKLCAAGTMSDYAAIVDRATFAFKQFSVGRKPYWATNSADGKYCFVSASGDDQVAVLDYASETQVATIPVGDHPQRMRMGVIRDEYLPGLPTSPPAGARPRAPAKLRVFRAGARGGILDMRVSLTSGADGSLSATYHANGRRTAFRLPIPSRPSGAPVTWSVRRSLPLAQRRRGTGILELRYGGNDRVREDAVRVRAAARQAGLRLTRSAIDAQGRLVMAGTIAPRAAGVVRVRLDYVGDGSRVRSLRSHARIARGRWSIRTLLPSQAARAGGQLSIQYTGHERRRIRGEQLSVGVAP